MKNRKITLKALIKILKVKKVRLGQFCIFVDDFEGEEIIKEQCIEVVKRNTYNN